MISVSREENFEETKNREGKKKEGEMIEEKEHFALRERKKKKEKKSPRE